MEFLLAMQPAGNGQGGGGMVSTLIMFAAIFAIFYFMIIRPQQKRQKQREAMLGELKKGDKIVTSGGIHGTVTGLSEGTVLVDVGNNVKMTFDRNAISVINDQRADAKK